MALSNELFAPNFVYHSAMGREIRGIKDYKQSMKEFFTAFPDAQYTVNDTLFEGEKAAVRYTITATHKGPLLGIPPTNKKMTAETIGIYHMVGGKLEEAWDKMDTLSLLQQIGVVPSPGKSK
jgi:steroid delta-isomerase-like uncharacterized protein